jgi:hypothetical protein
LLFGVLFGTIYLVVLSLYAYVALQRGSANLTGINGFNPNLLNGFRSFSASIAGNLSAVVEGSLEYFLTLFLLRALLRKPWLAAIAFVVAWVLVTLLLTNVGSLPPLSFVFLIGLWTLTLSLLVFIMLRFGFFALIVTTFVLNSVTSAFLTSDFSAWYGQSSLAVLFVVGAMAVWGFRLSLASRALFKPPLQA